MPTDLSHSESTYSFHALWPLVRMMVKFIDVPKNMKMMFNVGETKLSAVGSTDTYTWYYADGVGTVKAGELETLLVEISGAYGNKDPGKHKYDFIKGAFGCCKMVEAILRKYEYADKDLVEKLSVIFVQASGQGIITVIFFFFKKKKNRSDGHQLLLFCPGTRSFFFVDNCLRVWVMRPICKGKFLCFERAMKCEISNKIHDTSALISTMQLFCKLKVCQV